ncbi:MAG TPA: hypothetical protein PKM73_05735 [Verrucomicrobiota bacterium]|nr:hypothetical protein [Verrucomicrobiota bacterium]
MAPFGLLMEQLPTFDWRGDDLRLFDGLARAYTDFTETSLAGRVGQGVMLLAMEARGFVFVGNYPRSHGKRGPDFVFQHNTSASRRALAESKGSFVQVEGTPNIKAALRDGLDQLDAADHQRVSDSFAFGTFLRERDDPHPEPSLVAWTRAGYDGKPTLDEPDSDSILRGNYAAWLHAMGLFQAASDLSKKVRPERAEKVAFHLVDHRGEEYAVRPQAIVPSDELDWLVPFLLPRRGGEHVVVAGLLRGVLHRIREAMQDPSSTLGVELPSDTGQSEAQSDGGFKGSVLADGSLLGVMPAEALSEARLDGVAL